PCEHFLHLLVPLVHVVAPCLWRLVGGLVAQDVVGGPGVLGVHPSESFRCLSTNGGAAGPGGDQVIEEAHFGGGSGVEDDAVEQEGAGADCFVSVDHVPRPPGQVSFCCFHVVDEHLGFGVVHVSVAGVGLLLYHLPDRGRGVVLQVHPVVLRQEQ